MGSLKSDDRRPNHGADPNNLRFRSTSGIPRLRAMNTSRHIRNARSKGFSDGVASAFNPRGTQRPAPPRTRRSLGSLREDARAIERDASRLFRGADAA